MTNVPQGIRDMWSDVYRLFDVNYNIRNDPEEWKKFWDQAEEITNKYKDRHLATLITVVSEMLEDRALGKQYHQCTLEDMNLF